MKLRNIVTFQASSYVPSHIQQIVADHNEKIEIEDAFLKLLISMANIVMAGLKQRGFSCAEPFINLKWSAAQIEISVNSHNFACQVKLNTKKYDWFIHIGSLKQYGAPLIGEAYNYEDASEHRAICAAVAEVLRSYSLITDIRWLSYDE